MFRVADHLAYSILRKAYQEEAYCREIHKYNAEYKETSQGKLLFTLGLQHILEYVAILENHTEASVWIVLNHPFKVWFGRVQDWNGAKLEGCRIGRVKNWRSRTLDKCRIGRV